MRRCNNLGPGAGNFLERVGIGLFFCLFIASAPAEVRVFIQDSNSLAWVKYECTAGEVVRAFALDVTVDKGPDHWYFELSAGPRHGGKPRVRNLSGLLPRSHHGRSRDQCELECGASTRPWRWWRTILEARSPASVLPGSPWNSAGYGIRRTPRAVPGPTGTLCSLSISEQATVSVAANAARGGVVNTNPAVVLTPIFTGAVVHPPIPVITGLALTNGVLKVTFAGGELETAPTILGAWTSTGNSSGQYSEPVVGSTNKFYRVRGP